MYKIIVCIILLTFPINSFAHCSKEKKRFKNASALCHSLSAASVTTAAVGSIFGVFGLLGAVPGVGAYFACEAMETRKKDLQRCLRVVEDREFEKLWEEEEREERAKTQLEQDKLREKFEANIAQIHQVYDELIKEAIKVGEIEILKQMHSFAEEGFDLQDPEIRQLLDEYREKTRERIKQEVQRIQEEHNRAIDLEKKAFNI